MLQAAWTLGQEGVGLLKRSSCLGCSFFDLELEIASSRILVLEDGDLDTLRSCWLDSRSEIYRGVFLQLRVSMLRAL